MVYETENPQQDLQPAVDASVTEETTETPAIAEETVATNETVVASVESSTITSTTESVDVPVVEETVQPAVDVMVADDPTQSVSADKSPLIIEEKPVMPESEDYGVFNGAIISVDEDRKTAVCTIDSTLPGKMKVSIEMEMALGGFLMLKEFSRHVQEQADKLTAERV